MKTCHAEELLCRNKSRRCGYGTSGHCMGLLRELDTERPNGHAWRFIVVMFSAFLWHSRAGREEANTFFFSRCTPVGLCADFKTEMNYVFTLFFPKRDGMFAKSCCSCLFYNLELFMLQHFHFWHFSSRFTLWGRSLLVTLCCLQLECWWGSTFLSICWDFGLEVDLSMLLLPH